MLREFALHFRRNLGSNKNPGKNFLWRSHYNLERDWNSDDTELLYEEMFVRLREPLHVGLTKTPYFVLCPRRSPGAESECWVRFRSECNSAHPSQKSASDLHFKSTSLLLKILVGCADDRLTSKPEPTSGLNGIIEVLCLSVRVEKHRPKCTLVDCKYDRTRL